MTLYAAQRMPVPPFKWAMLASTAAFLITLWALSRRAAAAGRAAEQEGVAAESQGLKAGERWFAGAMEPLAGAPLPVVIVYEKGRDEVTLGDAPRVFWKETRRETQGGPFVLVTPEGAVKVEPSTDLVLRAPLAAGGPRRGAERERRTLLAPGTKVLVYGRVIDAQETAYREPVGASVLLPPERGPMQISAEPLGMPEKRRSALLARASMELFLGAALFATSVSIWEPRLVVSFFFDVLLGYAVFFFFRWRGRGDWYERRPLRATTRGRLADPEKDPAAPDAPERPGRAAGHSPLRETAAIHDEIVALCLAMREVDPSVWVIQQGIVENAGDFTHQALRSETGYHLWFNGRAGAYSVEQYATREALVHAVMWSHADRVARSFATKQRLRGEEHERAATEHRRLLLEAARPAWAAADRNRGR